MMLCSRDESDLGSHTVASYTQTEAPAQAEHLHSYTATNNSSSTAYQQQQQQLQQQPSESESLTITPQTYVSEDTGTCERQGSDSISEWTDDVSEQPCVDTAVEGCYPLSGAMSSTLMHRQNLANRQHQSGQFTAVESSVADSDFNLQTAELPVDTDNQLNIQTTKTAVPKAPSAVSQTDTAAQVLSVAGSPLSVSECNDSDSGAEPETPGVCSDDDDGEYKMLTVDPAPPSVAMTPAKKRGWFSRLRHRLHLTHHKKDNKKNPESEAPTSTQQKPKKKVTKMAWLKRKFTTKHKNKKSAEKN